MISTVRTVVEECLQRKIFAVVDKFASILAIYPISLVFTSSTVTAVTQCALIIKDSLRRKTRSDTRFASNATLANYERFTKDTRLAINTVLAGD
eukprot:gene2914-1153_t